MPDAHYRRHFDTGNQSPARQGVMSNDKRTVGEANRLAKMGLSDSNGVDIYTLKPIVTPSEEHVLPRSLGGRLAKIGLIDKRTNDRFGHDIDARLDEGLRAIRVITNALSADGIAPRALPAVPGDDGKKYKVEAGGIMIPHPEITTTKLATGGLLIQGSVPNDDVVRTMLRNYAKRSGKNIDELVRTFTESAKHRVEAPPVLTFGVSLWGDEEYRATAKIACNFFAYAAPSLFFEPTFNTIREFVVDGTRPQFPLVQAVEVEIGDVPGPLDHLVKVEVHPSGQVFGLVVYFGALAFVVSLGELPRCEHRSWSYRVDQLGGTYRLNDEADLRLPIPSFDDATAISYEDYLQVVVRQISRVLPVAHRIQQGLWLHRILEEPFRRFFEDVGEGEQTEEQRRALYGTLVMRVVEELAPQIARESQRRREALSATAQSDVGSTSASHVDDP